MKYSSRTSYKFNFNMQKGELTRKSAQSNARILHALKRITYDQENGAWHEKERERRPVGLPARRVETIVDPQLGSAGGPVGGGCHALEKERAKVARGLKLGLGRLFCGSEHSIFKPAIGWLTLWFWIGGGRGDRIRPFGPRDPLRSLPLPRLLSLT